MSEQGRRAEDLAAAYLQRRGLGLVTRNYRCRHGEIDLILRDGATLVFVEVRMRSSERFGGAAASITATKRARLSRAARHYLAGQSRTPPCRFDAVLIGADNKLEWLQNVIEQ